MIETAINEVLLPEEKIYEYQMITEIISKIAEKDTLEIFLEHLTLGEDKNEENTSTWNENFLNDKELQVPSERGNHVIGIHEVEPPFYSGVEYAKEIPVSIRFFSYVEDHENLEMEVEERLEQVKNILRETVHSLQKKINDNIPTVSRKIPKILNYHIYYEKKKCTFYIDIELTQDHLLESGQIVNQYRILEHKPGEEEKKATKVYKAFDTISNRIVALKTIDRNAIQPSPTEKEWNAFKEDLYKLAKLSHKNIVKIYEISTEPFFYIVMEYIESAPSKITTRLHIEPRRDIDVFIGIVKAVDFLHSHQLLHLSIAPNNIMVTKEKVPKLMDFNIFHIMHRFNKYTSCESLMFMAPEQVKGNPSPQSDIYSLGAALYNIWSEDNLFDEESARRLIKNIKKGGFEPLRHLDNEMEAICYKCLKQKQETRYQDAKEFVRDLKNYRDHEDIIAEYVSREEKKLRKKRFYYGNSYVFEIFCLSATCLWIFSCIALYTGFYFMNIRLSFSEMIYPCLILLGVICLIFSFLYFEE